MAQGVFLGAGGVKDLKSCYVGAGGVKAVKQIYIGQGGSVRLVWPSAIYNNGDIGTIGGGLTRLTSDQVPNFGTFFYDTGSYLMGGVRNADSRNANTFYGAFCPDTIDAAPYSSIQMTYTLTTRSSISSSAYGSQRYFGQLGLFISTYPFSFSESSTSSRPHRLACNGSNFGYSSSGTIDNSYIAAYSTHKMSSDDSTNTTMTLTLNLSSYNSNIYFAVGVADGFNMSSANIFTAHITEITLVV